MANIVCTIQEPISHGTSAKVTFAFLWISWIIIHEIHEIHEIQTEDFTFTLCIGMDYNPPESIQVHYNP